jgi:hypothetical protein
MVLDIKRNEKYVHLKRREKQHQTFFLKVGKRFCRIFIRQEKKEKKQSYQKLQ